MTKLPTLSDIYADKDMVIKQNELNLILNAEPKKEWIKIHPYVTGLKYIPVERIEYLLTIIFTKWRLEIKDAKLLANSVVVTVRVHVKDPISGEWDWQDGIGAAPIQVDKGSGAVDFDKMKSSALQIAAPAAESYAFKDAAEKFGKIFGKDLNRKDIIAYTEQIKKSITRISETPARIKAIITNQLKTLGVNIDDKEVVKTEIKKLTGLEITETNHIEITNRLSVIIQDQNDSN